MRKKVLVGGGGIVALLILALLAAPLLIDVNSYKPVIAAEVKKATGRDLVLDGPIKLSLLPVPEISISGVKFFNMAGSKNANMVEVKSVTVKPSLLALLMGGIEVSEVTLVEPKIVLEVNAEGKPNWEFAPSVAEAKPAAAKPSSAKPLSLGRLTIDNGTLIFSDSKAGLSVVAQKANFSASVGSLDGPYSLNGGATVNDAPLKLALAVGARNASGHTADVALEAGGGKLSFKGTLSELGPNARAAGMASASAEQLTTFIDTLLRLAGQPEPALPPLLAGKFNFDGAIDLSQSAVSAKDFKLALGQDNGSGFLSVTLKPALALDGKIVVPRLDLDRWLAALARPPTPAPSAATPAAPAARTTPAAPSAPAAGGGFPTGLTAKLALDVGEVIYNKKPIRNVAIELEARGGAVAVPKLAATLPGDMVLQARSTMTGDAARPQVSGEFSLLGPKLRETLTWLDVDVSSVPAAKLTRLGMKGKMSSTGGNVAVSDAAFELDDLKGSGGIAVTFGVPLSIVTNLAIDTVDLDSYVAPAAAGGQKPAAAGAAPAASPARPAVAGPTVGLKAKVARLIYQKETIGGIDVDVALQGSTLRLTDVKVSNLLGARLAVRGTVAAYDSAQPRPDIAFNFEAPDMTRLLKFAGATAPAGLGAVSSSGGVAGSVEQLTLREFAVNGMGHSLRASGVLSLPGISKGAPQSAAYKGSVTLNGQTLEGSVDAKLTGKPNIVADLRANVLDLDKIGGTGGGGARAPARGPPAAGAQPIDTAALRSVDGSFKLVAATLISAPLRIGNADLAATLKDGVLTIAHFRGALYGGSLALSGVVNGSQPALSLDFKGDANGIYVGEALRSTSGSNQFGGGVKVTIDGRLNANGITVRGAGATSDQIKNSMAGGAQLSGHIFAGADRALQVLGGAAAGAAGGVIDQTLGNVLGAVGQRGGVGVGNILNAIALVLNRFVNHDSPISGRVDVAGGVLTDKGLTVQGKNATARIATRTNFGNSTTDTTINFMIAEDGSAPYLITTARGSLSSPSLNVVRGTAKDPPGMTSTLPGVSNILPGQAPPGGAQPRSPIPNVPIPNIPGLFGR
jgi:uncharacterized protein involved in outer membrane biogenesis